MTVKPLNVLIVDDSATSRTYIRKTLLLSEVSIGALNEAVDGKQCLEILEKNPTDLLFLDINMPVLSGMEVIDQMKQKGLMEKVSVVIISSEGSTKRIDELRSKGIHEFLRKPYTPEYFKEVLTKIIGEKK